MKINLLGEYQILIDDEPASNLSTLKSRALLAYMAMEGDRPLRRAFLAELLWPELPSGVARTNLRQALKTLRQAIGTEGTSLGIRSSREAIEISKDERTKLDVDLFRMRIAAVRAHAHQDLLSCGVCSNNLEKAADLYKGDFLEDFFLPDSREFEEWAAIQREALQQDMFFVLERLIEIEIARGDLEKAIQNARRLVSKDPLDERNHRKLMHLLAMIGRRSDALRQFEVCKSILREEFDVEPSDETRKLLEEIKEEKIEKFQRQNVLKEGLQRKARWFWITVGSVLGLVIILAVVTLLIKEAFEGISDPSLIGTTDRDDLDHQALELLPFVPEEERAALMALFNTLEGDTWIRADGWDSDEWHCDWCGVSCSSGSVTELWLMENNLAGRIPPELSQLKNLVNLDLSNNLLHGGIPTELTTLRNLEVLRLGGNTWLNGEIPPNISELVNLTTLSLSVSGAGTQLEGEIPPELGDLTKLNHLEIADARFSGEIPAELGNLTHLGFLDLSGNPLSGTIPASFGQLGNLWHLSLGGGENNLVGSLPLELTNLQKLEVFSYQQTQLCEPQDMEFQSWLAGVDELYRSGIPCP
ncbi:MAG: BTAD domain-containing putative transcriptional regulator [Anaerolineales bacterium]